MPWWGWFLVIWLGSAGALVVALVLAVALSRAMEHLRGVQPLEIAAAPQPTEPTMGSAAPAATGATETAV